MDEFILQHPMSEDVQPDAIVLSIDRKFFPFAVLCLRSLKRAFPDHPQVLVFCQDVSEAQRRRLESEFGAQTQAVELAADEVGPLMQHLDQSSNAASFYARLRLWSEEFSDYKNILFLDADTIVVRSLAELFTRDDFFIVEDFLFSNDVIFEHHVVEGIQGLLAEDQIKIPESQGNAGVFLIPARYRNNTEHSLLVHLLERYHNHIRYADQSIINLWMVRRGLTPQPEFDYNLQTNIVLRAPSISFDEVAILHLTALPEHHVRLCIMRCLDFALRLRLAPKQLKIIWSFLLTNPRFTRTLASVLGKTSED